MNCEARTSDWPARSGLLHGRAASFLALVSSRHPKHRVQSSAQCSAAASLEQSPEESANWEDLGYVPGHRHHHQPGLFVLQRHAQEWRTRGPGHQGVDCVAADAAGDGALAE